MFDDLINDPDLPDIFGDDFLTTNAAPFDKDFVTMLPAEIKALNDRVERLEIALNIQTLHLELERAKRQKLASVMKQRRHETPITQLDALQQLIDTNQVYQEAVNFQIGGSIDHLSTVMFRCLSRTQHLLSFAFPCIPITPSDQPDVTSLLEEIVRPLSDEYAYLIMITKLPFLFSN